MKRFYKLGLIHGLFVLLVLPAVSIAKNDFTNPYYGTYDKTNNGILNKCKRFTFDVVSGTAGFWGSCDTYTDTTGSTWFGIDIAGWVTNYRDAGIGWGGTGSSGNLLSTTGAFPECESIGTQMAQDGSAKVELFASCYTKTGLFTVRRDRKTLNLGNHLTVPGNKEDGGEFWGAQNNFYDANWP
ncbi:MAG: hypothetical protein OXB88_05320 [Bacteriovoracales bacterium]|nr:hypothetical protein [Bacteriovoracales bacterium]